MRILFVDDEPRVLDGIMRSIFHLLDEWDAQTASGGEEALALMEGERFDVLVTDMRMPGMDGATLLTHVHQRFPDVVRIVLSGHTEMEAALRVVPVAHQFLSKPCSAEELQGVVARALNLRTLLTSEGVRTLVGHVKSLPTVPRLYSELTRLLANRDAGIGDVAKLIESDPAMCAKVLQLVNSSFFATAMPISDVQQAASRLGIRMLKNLALSAEVFDPGKVPGLKERDIEALARHGLLVGSLASSFMEGAVMRDDAFMAGMLHDIGKLVLWSEMPELFARVEEKVKNEGLAAHEAERELLSASHAEVGGYLLGVWGLPYRIAEAVAFHHRPSVPHGDRIDLLAAVHIANELSRSRPLSTEYLGRIGATDEDVLSWRKRAEELGLRVTEDAA